MLIGNVHNSCNLIVITDGDGGQVSISMKAYPYMDEYGFIDNLDLSIHDLRAIGKLVKALMRLEII